MFADFLVTNKYSFVSRFCVADHKKIERGQSCCMLESLLLKKNGNLQLCFLTSVNFRISKKSCLLVCLYLSAILMILGVR